MHKLRELLPSANSLFTFEAAARHESFTEAAKELHVSQPAVSKSVRQLEEYLGASLFHRQHRAIELTEEGRRFYQEIASSLDQLYTAALALRKTPVKESINVSFSSVFTRFWLLPRLDDFKFRYPELKLHLEIEIRDDRDLLREGIDLSSRLGDGNWPGIKSWYYADEEVIAICSPSYLSENGPIESAAELPGHRLLRLEDEFRPKVDWPQWLQRVGMAAKPTEYALVFTDASALIEAAVRGQGVALGWRHLVGHEIREGRLVQAVPDVHRTGLSVFLVAPDKGPMKRGAELFRDWIIDQTKSSGS